MMFSRTLSVHARGAAARHAGRRANGHPTLTCGLAVAALASVTAVGLDPATVALAQTVIAASDFENGTDGWWVSGDTPNSFPLPEWQPAGGNPGGRVRMVEKESVGSDNMWVAPPKYLGNQLAAYGGHLTFNQQQEQLCENNSFRDVGLIGAGMYITYDLPMPRVWPDWSEYEVLLIETAGWKFHFGPEVPTKEAFQQVLASLDAMQIRADFCLLIEAGSMDNVVLTKGPCDLPDGRLTAACKDGVGRISAKLAGGLPDTSYEFCLDGGDCVIRTTSRRGQAKAKFTDVAPGAHEVAIPDCDLAALVACR